MCLVVFDGYWDMGAWFPACCITMGVHRRSIVGIVVGPVIEWGGLGVMVILGFCFLLVSLVLKVEFLLVRGSKYVLVMFIVRVGLRVMVIAGGLLCACMFRVDVGSRVFICGDCYGCGDGLCGNGDRG